MRRKGGHDSCFQPVVLIPRQQQHTDCTRVLSDVNVIFPFHNHHHQDHDADQFMPVSDKTRMISVRGDMKAVQLLFLFVTSSVFSLDTVGITREELKVASENSRKLANELTEIVEQLRAELEQEEQEEREGRGRTELGAGAEEDDDKVENVLLQFQINKLEQEINKLTQDGESDAIMTKSEQLVKSNKSSKSSKSLTQDGESDAILTKSEQLVKSDKSSKSFTNRKKFRRMLARFYFGDHYVAF